MAIKDTTVSTVSPYLFGLSFPTMVPYAATLTTAGGVVTLTGAQAQSGIFVINCDDAQTLTLPTAALLNASLAAPVVGTTFMMYVTNTGDTTLTIAVGTGGTLVNGNSKSTVATSVAQASKTFLVNITGVAVASVAGTTDSYTLYGLGSVAAANA